MKKILLLTLATIGLAACAGKAATPVQPEVVEVSIIKYQFVPQQLEISKGQKVRWVNKEKRQYHSVWFKEQGKEESDYLFPEDTFEMIFTEQGDFNYVCGPHPEMTGKIIVK